MHRIFRGFLLAQIAAFAVTMTGCGDGTVTLDTEPVTGVVTVDGTPVEGATVMFVPVTDGQGTSATGYTDASGTYKLTAVPAGEVKGGDGAGTTPGEYHVAVIKSIAEAQMTEEEAMEKGVKYTPPPPGQSPKMTYVVPKKYNDPKKSGLKATVKEGDNTVPLDLKTK